MPQTSEFAVSGRRARAVGLTYRRARAAGRRNHTCGTCVLEGAAAVGGVGGVGVWSPAKQLLELRLLPWWPRLQPGRRARTERLFAAGDPVSAQGFDWGLVGHR